MMHWKVSMRNETQISCGYTAQAWSELMCEDKRSWHTCTSRPGTSPSIKTTSRQLTTAKKLSFFIIWIHNNNRILSSKCSGKFKSVYWFLRPAQKTSICCNTTRHQPLIEQTQRHEHQPSHKSQWSRPPGCTWGICPSSNTSGVTAPQRAIARGQLLKKEPKFKLNLEAFSCVIWAFPQIPHVNWSETSQTTPSAVHFFPSCKSIKPLCNQRSVLQTVIFQRHQSIPSSISPTFTAERNCSWIL